VRLAHFSFRREAWWLFVLVLVPPALAFLGIGVIPAVLRWLGWR
jgi:hypothetical protein